MTRPADGATAGGRTSGVATSAPDGVRLGAADAGATLVVYGTWECLHCRLAWPALRALVAEVEGEAPGALALEWRHHAPAGAFPHAAHAAAAVEAAALQGGPAARLALHEALLHAPPPLWPETVRGAATALGLDAGQLARDAASDEVRERLAALAARAAADAVRGTPAVFLVHEGGDAPPVRLDARDGVALRAAVLDQLAERAA